MDNILLNQMIWHELGHFCIDLILTMKSDYKIEKFKISSRCGSVLCKSKTIASDEILMRDEFVDIRALHLLSLECGKGFETYSSFYNGDASNDLISHEDSLRFDKLVDNINQENFYKIKKLMGDFLEENLKDRFFMDGINAEVKLILNNAMKNDPYIVIGEELIDMQKRVIYVIQSSKFYNNAIATVKNIINYI